MLATLPWVWDWSPAAWTAVSTSVLAMTAVVASYATWRTLDTMRRQGELQRRQVDLHETELLRAQQSIARQVHAEPSKNGRGEIVVEVSNASSEAVRGVEIRLGQAVWEEIDDGYVTPSGYHEYQAHVAQISPQTTVVAIAETCDFDRWYSSRDAANVGGGYFDEFRLFGGRIVKLGREGDTWESVYAVSFSDSSGDRWTRHFGVRGIVRSRSVERRQT